MIDEDAWVDRGMRPSACARYLMKRWFDKGSRFDSRCHWGSYVRRRGTSSARREEGCFHHDPAHQEVASEHYLGGPCHLSADPVAIAHLFRLKDHPRLLHVVALHLFPTDRIWNTSCHVSPCISSRNEEPQIWSTPASVADGIDGCD